MADEKRAGDVWTCRNGIGPVEIIEPWTGTFTPKYAGVPSAQGSTGAWRVKSVLERKRRGVIHYVRMFEATPFVVTGSDLRKLVWRAGESKRVAPGGGES